MARCRLLLVVSALLIQVPHAAAAEVADWQVLLAGDPTSQPEALRLPSGVALDEQGNLYVVDSGNSRIEKLSAAGQVIATWGSLGTGSDQLRRPRGIAVDPNGTLYVADTANHRIQRWSADGAPLGVWGGIGSEPGEFILPSSVALDSAGNLYVTDTGNHRVQKLAPDGQPLAAWSEGLHFPHGIALDAQEVVYVSDATGLHTFSADGQPIAAWPQPGQVSDAYGVAVDDAGNVYLADTDNGRVVELSSSGEVVAAWGSEGSQPGEFRFPEAVAVDHQGRVFVADRGNDRVQALLP